MLSGHRQSSIYDQLDDTEVYNDIGNEPEVCNAVDYTISSNASALELCDQSAQQSKHKFKSVIMYLVKLY